MKMPPMWLMKPMFLLFMSIIYLFFSRIGRMILIGSVALSVVMMGVQIHDRRFTEDFGIWLLVAFGSFSMWISSNSIVHDMKK